MSFGMRIWGADGALQMDENSFTMRVVYSTLVTFPSGAKATQDFAVPGSTASNSVAISIPIGDPSATANGRYQFETEMLSGVARVYNYNRGFEASLATPGTQRLLVIRFA
jgi:hypothetical protein